MHARAIRAFGLCLAGALLAGAAWMRFGPAGAVLTQSARAFLDSLNQAQRAAATLPFDDQRRVDWHFIPKPTRKGLMLAEMDDSQRQRARALLAAALSDVGYEKAQTIISLEEILRELERDRPLGPLRDPLRYYFTIFGTPDEAGRWGLSIEGHHLSLNFVIDRNRVVAHTPHFLGANPAQVRGQLAVGPPQGTRVLAKKEDAAFALLGSLDEEQRAAAVIAEQAPRDVRAAGEAQVPASQPQGIAGRRLNANQQKLLAELVEAYLENMAPEVAEARRAEIRARGWDDVYFAWSGAERPGVGHHYALQGPTFLVELNNTQPDSQGNRANHVHSVWRDLRGDFGLPR